MHINDICTNIRHSEEVFEGAKPVLSSYSSLLYFVLPLLILLFLYLNGKIRENPAKIPVWQKIRQSIPQFI
jgi:hypothetical protein